MVQHGPSPPCRRINTTTTITTTTTTTTPTTNSNHSNTSISGSNNNDKHSNNKSNSNPNSPAGMRKVHKPLVVPTGRGVAGVGWDMGIGSF